MNCGRDSNLARAHSSGLADSRAPPDPWNTTAPPTRTGTTDIRVRYFRSHRLPRCRGRSAAVPAAHDGSVRPRTHRWCRRRLRWGRSLVRVRSGVPNPQPFGFGGRVQMRPDRTLIQLRRCGCRSPRLPLPACRGCGSMVERGLPKPETRVRFPSPAPTLLHQRFTKSFCPDFPEVRIKVRINFPERPELRLLRARFSPRSFLLLFLPSRPLAMPRPRFS